MSKGLTHSQLRVILGICCENKTLGLRSSQPAAAFLISVWFNLGLADLWESERPRCAEPQKKRLSPWIITNGLAHLKTRPQRQRPSLFYPPLTFLKILPLRYAVNVKLILHLVSMEVKSLSRGNISMKIKRAPSQLHTWCTSANLTLVAFGIGRVAKNDASFSLAQ